MPSNDIRFPPEALAALSQGRTIEAIKIVREATGLGLKEAKDAVEAYMAHGPLMKGLESRISARVDGGFEIPQEAADALARGDLIDAIKRLREANPHLGLKEAKDAVDGLKRKSVAGMPLSRLQRVPTVSPGDSGRGGWWLLVVAVLAMAAWYLLSGRG